VGLPTSFVLGQGEEVLANEHPNPLGSLAAYLFTVGLYEIWRRHRFFIITNRRVAVANGVVIKNLKAIPIDRVQDVALHTRVLTGGVSLSSAGGFLGVEAMGPLRRGKARALANAIQGAQSSSPDRGV
jgi:membrane protein YdbS with pleckstrin-like domain